LNELERLGYISAPVKKEADVTSTALRRGANPVDTRQTVHCFFDWASDRDEDLLSGHYTVVDDYYDSWKISLREDSYGELKCGIQSGRAEQRYQHHDRA